MCLTCVQRGMWAMIACCIALVLWCAALTYKDGKYIKEKEAMGCETSRLNQSQEQDAEKNGG